MILKCKSFPEYFILYRPEQFEHDLWNHRVAECLYGFRSPLGKRNGKTRYIKGKPIISPTNRGDSWEVPPPILWAICSARLLISAFGFLCAFRLSIVIIDLLLSLAIGVSSQSVLLNISGNPFCLEFFPRFLKS